MFFIMLVMDFFFVDKIHVYVLPVKKEGKVEPNR